MRRITRSLSPMLQAARVSLSRRTVPPPDASSPSLADVSFCLFAGILHVAKTAAFKAAILSPSRKVHVISSPRCDHAVVADDAVKVFAAGVCTRT